jgi:hypothetical protein
MLHRMRAVILGQMLRCDIWDAQMLIGETWLDEEQVLNEEENFHFEKMSKGEGEFDLI